MISHASRLVANLSHFLFLPERVARIRTSIHTKLLVAFLGIAALLVALGAIGLSTLQSANQRATDLVQLERRIAAYRQLQHNTTGQLYATASAFLATERREFDAAMRQLQRFAYDFDRAEFVARDDVELLRGIESDYSELIDTGNRIIELVRKGRFEEARELHRERSVPLARRLERQTYSLVSKGETDMVERAELSREAYKISQIAVVAAAVGSLLLALGLGFTISSSIIEPLREIRARLQRIAQGDFHGQLKVPNRDELGDLAENANLMSKKLDELYGKLESLSIQLSKYLSPQVYSSIFSGEQAVEIASKRKKLTVFFSDIANFTETTDSLESEELTSLLNHYLTEMSKIAFDHGATVDKYVGDAVMAFFGDPETKGVKEDAVSCVQMAIAMQRRMRELQSEWLDKGLERPFQLRIGINTGFCTVGNFGSEDRMDYTIIGNEVNLAARLQSQAELGGILIAHETYALIKDTVMAEEGETLTVKGFSKPVRTYNVAGLFDDLVTQGRVIRKEQNGVRVLVDLKTGGKANAIKAVEDVLLQLKKDTEPE